MRTKIQLIRGLRMLGLGTVKGLHAATSVCACIWTAACYSVHYISWFVFNVVRIAINELNRRKIPSYKNTTNARRRSSLLH
jgi:nicotinamide riboside transporter PnuC